MDQSPHNNAMLLTPQPPSSVKIQNTKSKPIKQSPIKQSSSAEPRLYRFDWPEFNEGLFDQICIYFANVIGEIKTQIPPDVYRDNDDIKCCPRALITIAKDMIMLFMKHKITTPNATSNYANGYKVLILSVIGYYLIQNEWENVHKRIKSLLPALPALFDDSMMVIMKMVTSGFGHSELESELESELREITKRLFMVDLNINIRPIGKPNDGGGRKRLTRRRRKLKPSNRMTKHYK